MAKRPGTNKENYQETQSLFLALGRLEFATHGYARASTNRIVEQSGMARGSLYYHFKDKEDLFRTIWTHLTMESNNEIARQITPIEDPWQALLKGGDLFLEHSLDPVFRRIVLIEGLVAIPYIERMSITGDSYSQTISKALEASRDKGYIPAQLPLRPMALMIYSILAEYGRALEFDANPEESKKGLYQMYAWALERMRLKP